jgi:hypothetical protein
MIGSTNPDQRHSLTSSSMTGIEIAKFYCHLFFKKSIRQQLNPVELGMGIIYTTIEQRELNDAP